MANPRPTPPNSAMSVNSSLSSGLRFPSNRRTIYDRNLNRSRNLELSRASFGYLFAQMIVYAQNRVQGIGDLERKLNEQGHPLGVKLLDLLLYRTPSYSSLSPTLRPIRILPLLQFVTNPLWRSLFGRTADGLERSTEQANEYMVIDNDPFVAGYVSYPRELEQLNVCAYVAGIVEGVCSGAGFGSKVTAVGVPSDMWPSKTVYLVRFDQEVMEREAALLKA